MGYLILSLILNNSTIARAEQPAGLLSSARAANIVEELRQSLIILRYRIGEIRRERCESEFRGIRQACTELRARADSLISDNRQIPAEDITGLESARDGLQRQIQASHWASDPAGAGVVVEARACIAELSFGIVEGRVNNRRSRGATNESR